MQTSRQMFRSLHTLGVAPRVNARFLSSTTSRLAVDPKERIHSNVEDYRKTQTERPDNPHMTNTSSTISNEMPSVGKDKAPPELIKDVDPKFVPKDSVPENTERMTGQKQLGAPDEGPNKELGVGEMEGAKIKVAPLRREGEDPSTMRARLLYQSRKRGTLESDLLLSTFAASRLGSMTPSQLRQYDLFLDENDWDIYYWATQSPASAPTSLETAEGSVNDGSSSSNIDEAKSTDTAYSSPASPAQAQETDAWRQGQPRSGEWAQTVGTFKPAYRPVPMRWRNSEILKLLREHVRERRSGGEAAVVDAKSGGVVDHELGHVEAKGTGMGRMPEVQVFD